MSRCERRLGFFLPFALLGAGAVGLGAGCAAGPLHNLQRGCEQGSATACFQLGVSYYEGKDDKGHTLDLDYYKARKSFSRACEREHPTACYNLGYMHQKGEGGPVDKPYAVEAYKKGCELGDTTACGKAAVAYRDGQGASVDLVAAAKLAKRGCEKQDKDDCELYKKLAVLPGSGGTAGVTAEVSQYAENCDAGSADACFELGVRFDQGKGIAQSKEKAARAYGNACDKDDLRGCHNLGIMLIDGEGIPRNLGRGLKLLNQSCEKGQRKSCEVMVGKLNKACMENDADACTVMGGFFIKGDKGLEPNITKGVDFLRRGCKLGDKDGCELLRKLGLDPTG